MPQAGAPQAAAIAPRVRLIFPARARGLVNNRRRPASVGHRTQARSTRRAERFNAFFAKSSEAPLYVDCAKRSGAIERNWV